MIIIIDFYFQSSPKSKTKKDEQKSKSNASKLIQKPNAEMSMSFFDLRTTQGQILFLFISIGLSALVQLMPNDAFKTYIFNYSSAPTNQTAAADALIHATECNKQCNSTKIAAAFKRPTYWFYGKSKEESHLKHVQNVLRRLGYDKVTNETTDWDLLWAHDYPFRTLYPKLHNLKPHQRVNHFPGCGFLTNKVDLATTDLKCIPKAFRLPQDRDEFKKYADNNPNKMFVQKHNQHRFINIKTIQEIDFNDNDTFLQEYIDNPLLVDGHRFDIGVYVIITSIDPLRIYIYKGDILFRYCPQKYYPFDPTNADKYIVGDDYLPTWDVPSLSPYYNGLGFGMKDSFDAYMRSKNRDPSVIWSQVEDAIRSAILSKEQFLADVVSYFHKFVF